MSMFMGEYRHSIDNKGRLIIPSRYRDELQENFTLTRGLDGCLYIYDVPDWDAFVEKLNATPLGDRKARETKRFFLSQAVNCELDKQGRILIPPYLRKAAGLDKGVVLAGVGNRIEIWDESKWDEIFNYEDNEYVEAAMEALGI